MAKMGKALRRQKVLRYEPLNYKKMTGSVEEVIKHLQEVLEKHPGKELVLGYETDSYYGVEGFNVCWHEMETDEEFQLRKEKVRKKEEEARRAQEEEQERAKDVKEYERLKRKLGIWS